MNFSHIIGQENIINNLKRGIKSNHLVHSYLFEGAASMGKMKLAKVFAKTLLCEEQGTEPCNRCSSCLKMDSGNHPDFYVHKADGNSFKKEQIEEIQKTIRVLPYEGKRKVYILEDIDKMTRQAENSFLKTLEEPPEYAVLIMTVTNSYSLLPTVVSRCQVIKFIPVGHSRIKSILIEEYHKTPEEAGFIASFSGGIVGKAISLSESEAFKNLREGTIDTIHAILTSEKYRVFSLSQFFQDHKDEIEVILDILLFWFRDVLMIKETRTKSLVMNKDKMNKLKEHNMRLSRNKIHDIIEEVNRTKNNITSNVNFQLSIEALLLKIQEV